MESSQEDLQAWESFQRDFEESKEKDKIEGTHSNKLQYYIAHRRPHIGNPTSATAHMDDPTSATTHMDDPTSATTHMDDPTSATHIGDPTSVTPYQRGTATGNNEGV